MDEAAVRKSLCELGETMFSIRPCQTKGPEGAYVSCSPGKESSLDESISMLRLQIKYLLFDLEATRRENRYLRQLLDSRRRNHFDGDSDNRNNST